MASSKTSIVCTSGNANDNSRKPFLCIEKENRGITVDMYELPGLIGKLVAIHVTGILEHRDQRFTELMSDVTTEYLAKLVQKFQELNPDDMLTAEQEKMKDEMAERQEELDSLMYPGFCVADSARYQLYMRRFGFVNIGLGKRWKFDATPGLKRRLKDISALNADRYKLTCKPD
jgi:hypothetical protein